MQPLSFLRLQDIELNTPAADFNLNQPASPFRPQVVHLMHMFRLGMEFASTPHGYVVHSPHPVANSWNTTQSTGFWYKVRGRGRAGRDWRRAECRGGCTCAWAWRLPV